MTILSMWFRLFPRKKNIAKLRSEADRARDARHWREAALLYEEVIAESGPDAGMLIQAGHMRKEAGDLAAAETHYVLAKQIVPEDADLSLQLGHFYKIAGRDMEAYSAYRQALQLDPTNEDVRAEFTEMGKRVRAQLGVREETVQEREAAPVSVLADTLTLADVQDSGLFDAGWYLKTYTDIAALGADPLVHFFEYGRQEGRLPGPHFEGEWYVEAYPEVLRSGLDPFAHYLLIGRARGFRPAGPPMYERWVGAFDTLGEIDRQQIAAHVFDKHYAAPDVVLAIDATTAPFVSDAIIGLRAQILKPRHVHVCLAADCPAATSATLKALIGSDEGFTIADGRGGPRRAGESGAFEDVALVLLDAGVQLREHALYMLVDARERGAAFAYADEDRLDERGVRTAPFFKPDASPELLRQTDYVGPCALLPQGMTADDVAAALARGGQSAIDVIRDAFFEQERADIAHVPFVLFHDRAAAVRHERPALPGPEWFATDDLPSVTIIVPTRDHVDLLGVCIESILGVTDYPAAKLDLVIVDNGSTDPDTLDYLVQGGDEGERRFRVLRDPQPFNFARLNNIAAATATSDIVLLLNNDTEVQDSTWLRGIVRYAMLPDVGAVGPKLLYDDGTIQHAGVVLGIGVAAAHAHCGVAADAPGDYGFAQRTREVSAVTGACLAMRRSVLEELGGLDEELKVAFNDVALCLAAIEHGYRNIYVHDVWIRHFESKSRGVDDTFAKVDIFIGEANYARRKHRALFAGDPWYSPNLSVMLESFYGPAFPPRCVYPWRDHAREARKPRVLLLAGIKDATSEIATTFSYQASYLADAGCDVIVGTPARLSGLPTAAGIRHATIKHLAAAANFAVINDVDCIVTHTALYGGVSRLLGARPRVILHHHGFTVEEAGGANTGRDAHVSIRLALPAAAAVVGASEHAIAELEDDGEAILLPPGGDRPGSWTLAMTRPRGIVRDTQGWATRTVIVFEVAGASLGAGEMALLDRIGEAFDPASTVLVLWTSAPLVKAPDGFQIVQPFENDKPGIFAAADLFVRAQGGGSPLLAAEAASFGLPVLSIDEQDGVAIEVRIAEAAGAGHSLWSRQPRAPLWADQLDRFRALLVERGGIDAEAAPPTPRMLMSSAALVEASGLFDAQAYLRFNPDVAQAKVDPWHHFVTDGAAEGRRPTWLFDTNWYRARYPEVARARLSPIAHYLSQPRGNYDPNPYFSNSHYLETYPDVAETGLSPLVHYLRIGASEGRDIGRAFDADFYARSHADVAGSGMAPFVHFLTIGDAEGRLPVKPALSPVDLFDDAALEKALRLRIADIVPRPVGADGITDRRGAARFVITLLRRRDDLRRRFPYALSGGGTGRFAAWLKGEGAIVLGLSARASFFVDKLFETEFSERIRQIYLVRTDLRRKLPFALLPEGAGDLLAWGLETGVPKEGLAREEVWWLLLLCAEQPARELATTYLFTPSWQVNHPTGATIFGDDAFLAWLGETYGIKPAWTPDTHAALLTPDAEIRVAYHATTAWQAAHPDPFASADAANALLDWLASPEAGLGRRQHDWVAALDKPAVAAELAVPGLNMVGHFCYPSGLKTSTEALVRGARDVGLRVTERDVWVQLPGDENHHVDFRGLELYDTTIILTQPEPYFDAAFQRAGLAPRDPRTYRIAYWYWEQDKIPEHWQAQADQVDEIWTSTHFVGDALKQQFDIPVQVIPHGMELPPYAPLSRGHFGLPEDHTLFLFTFHMMSVMERKNPLGLIEAFANEFSPDEKVGLVLKTSFGSHHPRQIEELRKAAAGHNITIIDAVYTKAEVLALMDTCDAYISLHRSEGFGLTMIEAMLIGKPTIATGYSANLDFMTAENSLLVDYELLTLDKDYPPYKAGSRWAKASTRHAGQCMRKVVADPAWARALGLKAKAELESKMSFEASGRMVAARLAEIETMRRTSPARRGDGSNHLFG